ncbi:cupin domain-containing protein [Rubellimicrobium rubrum]|uniref:cupin domain-containing protein n=1 Tax=Rubellimicrobium rubrum TaxID=2585369 RepID=UPI001C3F25C3|nr:AraC family transcriptional regulator [Rubellimicrobium rubrum]
MSASFLDSPVPEAPAVADPDRPSSDPFSEIVALLRPEARASKLVEASGPWRVRRSELGRPFYCAVLEGAVRLAVLGEPEATLRQGDVALIPEAQDFEASSVVPPARRLDPDPVLTGPGRVRVGEAAVTPDTRLVVGYCRFGSPDAQLLVGMLPRLALARSDAEEGDGGGRLATLARLLDDEGRTARPGRDAVLRRLVEILLIEALRGAGGSAAAPGLLRGLADPRLAPALRRLHESPDAPWTMEALAGEAALSRSAFFERFRRAVGMPPMT